MRGKHYRDAEALELQHGAGTGFSGYAETVSLGI